MLLSTQPTINLRHGCKGQPSRGETRVLGAVIVEKQTMGRPDNLRLQIQGLYAIPLTDMTRTHPCAQKKPLCAACYVAAGVRLCEGREEADERRLGLAVCISEIEDQWEVAVVDGDARDVDDAGDALLGLF